LEKAFSFVLLKQSESGAKPGDLLSVGIARHTLLPAIDREIRIVDRQFRLADEPGICDALDLPGDRDSVTNLVLPDERNLPNRQRRILDQVTGLLNTQIGSGIDPDFALEESLAFLFGGDLED